MSRPQRLELYLFSACFFAFAYFHQGGGWNQNARFAEVRAIVEEGRFAIDDFLVYELDQAQGSLRRHPVRHGEYERDGQRFRLAWVDMEWNLYPVGDQPLSPGVEKAPIVEKCASGDIAYVPHTGHFHPNKPPGTSFLAVPAYWAIFHAEHWLGLNPDHWWTMTLNAWLTTICSVGLISALGCVLFFRTASELAAGATLPAGLATLAFAFGTTFFPFATILFDHAPTASLLVAAFYFIRRGSAPDQGRLLFAAGFFAGFAAITNYVAAVCVILLGLYLLLGRRGAGDQETAPPSFNLRPSLWYSAGVLGPFLLICWYGWVCFGSPFKLNTDFQNPLFKDPAGALGMFATPNLYVGALIAVSPFRGVFFLAPVLLMGVYGLVVWLREKTFVAEARLCLAVFAFFFLVNMCFNGYHGGFSAGPRYLIPGLPFLALPLVVAFARRPKLTGLLAAVSIGQQLLLTATDAQNPLAVGGHARNDRRDDFRNNLLADYAWPLFAHGRAWPMLEQLLEVHMEKEEDRLAAEVSDPDELQRRAAEVRTALRAGIERGEPSPFLLATVVGPVSVNPVGVFEGLFTYAFYPPGSPPARAASFNVGEFLWPGSRWSLLPLLFVSGGSSVALLLGARRLGP